MHLTAPTCCVRRALNILWLAPLLIPALARAQAPDSTAASPDTAAAVAPVDTSASAAAAAPTVHGTAPTPPDEDALEGLGFENLTLAPDGRAVAFENRRYRHSAEARGLAAARLHPSPAAPVAFYERRLSLVAAAVIDTGGATPLQVGFPSDARWTPPPAGAMLDPVRRSFDLELVPLFTYEIGHILDPVLVRFEVEPRLRWNPWPGGRATASLILPLKNDFPLDELHPDLHRVRPGPTTLEQFAWIEHLALVSGTAGIFAGNRYGASVGAALPFAGGAFLADAQADLTGYLAFPSSGAEYSTPSLFTGFAGLSYRPPRLDVSVRARGEKFLYGDRGIELELNRSMGDLDVAFFYQRTSGFSVHGIRVDIPLPPARRPTGRSLRVLPAARFPLVYRDEVAPVGRGVSGVASREEFLRQLSQTGLAANGDRYRREPPDLRTRTGGPLNDHVSLTGMTGFTFTPWCGVMSDRRVELGYNRIPKSIAYDHRGQFRNDVYYAALGFLPRFEAGLRWTVLPGSRAFSDQVPESQLIDSDRMLSGRIELFTPRTDRPGLAVGIEDAVGTRRFHSTYAVAGIPFEYQGLHSRATLGYAFEALTATRYTLDGAFGAVEVSALKPLSVSLEYDTEKWNTEIGIEFGFGLRARAALLDMRHVSLGAGWSVGL